MWQIDSVSTISTSMIDKKCSIRCYYNTEMKVCCVRIKSVNSDTLGYFAPSKYVQSLINIAHGRHCSQY